MDIYQQCLQYVQFAPYNLKVDHHPTFLPLPILLNNHVLLEKHNTYIISPVHMHLGHLKRLLPISHLSESDKSLTVRYFLTVKRD